MLFITNRRFTDNEFNLEDNSPNNHVYYCDDKDGVTEIGSISFMSLLKYSNYKHILLYIHGFNNLPDDVLETAYSLQEKLGDEILIVPIIWPCDNDLGLLSDYWDDQKTSDMCGYSLARCLQKMEAWQHGSGNQCNKRMSILAHSMGNRVLRSTLQIWNEYDRKDGIPSIFDNIFMVAADVRNDTLCEDRPGNIICDAASRVYVVHSHIDMALGASKLANGVLGNKSRRLGKTGAVKLQEENVTNIDFTAESSDYAPTCHNYLTHPELIEFIQDAFYRL